MNAPTGNRARTVVVRSLATLASAALIAVGLTVVPATADTLPASPTTPVTVAADALPTPQINGVAWAQVVVGDIVYVAGKFTTARPYGSAVGANTVARNNILAYNIETGALVTSFAPNLNAQALAITASPDGSRIYVTGDFTTVDGTAYYRIAAFNTATGAVIPSFKPVLGSQGRAVTATNTTVYVGGTFRTVSGQARDYLASINAANGAVNPWVANTNAAVTALVLTTDGSKVVVGGRFTSLSGTTFYGLGAVNPTTGAAVPWAVSSTVRDYGTQSAITSLTATADRIYGTGYAYNVDGSAPAGNFEGTFSADPSTGAINWLEDCHGDSYSAFPLGDAVYVATHAHYCGNIGGFPQTEPWTMHYGLAFSKAATGTITADPHGYYNFAGNPSPTLLDWFPKLTPGTYTGQGQAGWSVSGNSKYILYGGEFTHVNGVAQQGLVRFAVPSAAPNKVAPIVTTELVPTVASFTAGEVRLSWTTTYDYDNANLTYKLVRDGQTASPIYTATQYSNFYTLSRMGYVDTGLVPGSTHTYRLYVSDGYGNTISRLAPTATVSTSDSGGAYSAAVEDDAPKYYWPLDEASGATAFDHAGFDDMTLGSGTTRGESGIISPTTATAFSGASTALGASPVAETAPNTYTVEAWIKTTTTSGGKIMGFGNSATGNSGSYDRHVYMDNSGRIWFGNYPGGVRTVNSAASFNDGQWHHIAASLGSSGMTLYVDGKVVGTRSDVTSGQAYTGYWRVGGDNIGGWTSQPSSNYFAGTIAQVAVYPTTLSRSQLVDHYVASGRTSPLPTAPTDAYGNAVYSADPLFYYRLGEGSGSLANDSGPNDNDGVYSGTVLRSQPSGVAGTTDSSVGFTNGSGVATNATFSNPTTYSLETWFQTSTTSGGKLVGFGSNQTGLSGSYDRHLYMQDDGHLVFGTWTGQTNTVTTPAAYNDGLWHHAVASQSAAGIRLYVDGALVGTNPQTGAQAYSGYWRAGGDTTWGSSSPYFNGRLDELAVYGSALSDSTVAQHYSLGAGVAPANQLPIAAFEATGGVLTASFDSSGSSDPDGSIVGYSWDFGDGTTGSGANPTHGYAAGGTYTVTLTVTDDDDGTATASRTVTVTTPPANQPPTAAFTSSTSVLTATFSASGSSDADGTVTGYAWDYGDSTSGTGVSSSHTYAAAGSYTVTLTVTDDDGATATTTGTVTVTAPPANQPPTATFTSTVSDLAASFSASGSSDPDGAITGYAWNYGDSTSGTGVSSSHTYMTAGTYTVTLTVTDDDGATATTTRSVTVAAAPVATVFGDDTFERSVTTGWSSAPTGGPWTVTGNASALSVTGGAGQVTLAAGSTRTMTLGSIAQTNTDSTMQFALNAVPTGGGAYTSIFGRQVGANNYAANVWVKSTGAVALVLKQGTTVLSNTVVPGLTYTAGMQLQLRLQVTGTSPTTVKARIWQVGQPEPTTWLSSVTDSTAALQTPGSVALQATLSASSTAGIVTRIDNFNAKLPQ